MPSQRQILSGIMALTLTVSSAASSVTAEKEASSSMRRYPAHLSEYDLMTDEDIFYFHYLNPLCTGGDDLAKWPLVKTLATLAGKLIDAPTIAGIINDTIVVSDEQRAKPIVDVVKACAKLLNVPVPEVCIKGDPRANAYVTRLREPHFLVLTSGLLDLYEDDPEQLRFVIGHELGHLKSNHIRCHLLGSTVIQLFMGERGKEASSSFKDQYIAPLAVGALLRWYRASESSADRAGLICVGGDVRTAQQALLKLQHGVKTSNKLMDPDHPDFDPDKVLAKQIQLEREPFVKILRYLQSAGRTHPFIPERCAALKQWSLSAQYERLYQRTGKAPSEKQLVILGIDLTNISAVDTYVPYVDSGESDPFLRLTYADQPAQETEYQKDKTDASWPDLEKEFAYVENCKLILEVYDYNSALPNKFIGSCLIPLLPTVGKDQTVSADVRLDVMKESTIVDRPTARVKYRVNNR